MKLLYNLVVEFVQSRATHFEKITISFIILLNIFLLKAYFELLFLLLFLEQNKTCVDLEDNQMLLLGRSKQWNDHKIDVSEHITSLHLQQNQICPRPLFKYTKLNKN